MEKDKKLIGIIVNTSRGDPTYILKNINKILKKYNIESIIIDYDISSYRNINKSIKILKNVFMLISIGGDGTLLSALKIAVNYGISVLPVYNGTLGFISEIPPEESYIILEEYFSNKRISYKIEPRTLLSVLISKNMKKCKEYLAINELVMSKSSGRVIHINITISEKLISSVVADGVVIATPTGSTAYALSAGGPILSPTIDAVSFVPIAPHSLTFRPLVIPKGDSIKLELTKKSLEAMITIDGYDICKFYNDDIVEVKISDKSCYIFQSANRLFYDILHNKLNWGR